MPNMKTLDRQERAKLAKAYIAGGFAPYQAMRNTGFRTVEEMNREIRALNSAGSSEPSVSTVAAPELPDEAKAAEGATEEKTAAETPDTGPVEKPFYPFRKPGDNDGGVYVASPFYLETKHAALKLIGKGDTLQITLTEPASRPFLRIPLTRMQEVMNLMDMAMTLVQLTKEENYDG